MTDHEVFSRTAREFSDAFTRATRDNGERFVKLRGNAPEWIGDAIREAHGSEFPNDYVYGLCEEIAEAIADLCGWHDYPEGVHDELGEIADTAVSIYTHDRLRWAMDNTGRLEWVTDAVAEFGAPADPGDVADLLGLGMYQQASHVAHVIYEAIESAADYASEEVA